MWLCLTAVVLAGWAYLATFDDAFQALCRALPLGSGPRDAALIFSMWLAMALAMMLPSAAPMLSTYMDIAEAAQAKAMRIVPPAVLAAGYCLVWAVFAGLMTAIQVLTAYWLGPPGAAIAGAVLVIAGLYQFSSLKHACLTKCRAPMPYFLRRWSDRPHRVLLMGVEQGLFCLGCCWALMALGLLTGLMNLAWMAAIAVIAMLEKLLPEPKPVIYGTGLGLVGAGMLLMVFG